MSGFHHVLNIVLAVIAVYAFVSNFNYFVLMSLGFFVQRTQRTTEGSVERDPLFRSKLMPGISIIAPAHNEELSIVQSTRSMLSWSIRSMRSSSSTMARTTGRWKC